MNRSCFTVIFIALALIGGVGWLLFVPTSPPSSAVMPTPALAVTAGSASPLLARTYDQSPTAFTFDYPDGWVVQFPQQGLLVVAPPSTLRGEPGASMVVQRSVMLAVEDDLDAAMDTFLENGPLRNQRDWQILGERADAMLGERPARRVELRGRQVDDAPITRVIALVARANSGAVYVITFTAPDADWETASPTFEAILATMRLLE